MLGVDFGTHVQDTVETGGFKCFIANNVMYVEGGSLGSLSLGAARGNE